MLSSRLEIKIDPVMRGWLQQTSFKTGKSQAEIIREAIAQIQQSSAQASQAGMESR